MATTTKKYQLIQKKAADEYLLLHPETDAEVVKLAATGITATNVKAALLELKDAITAITGGGVVTGVKGDSETAYRLGNVNITKANIGLGNVDNTSDANKPVSTAQQTALNAKEDKTNLKALAYKDSLGKTDVGLGNVTNDAQVKRSEMGVASGVATLDESGKVPTSQLPSYVDDVLEYDSQTAFPSTGETGKIYVAKDTNKTYRWGGTDYVEISASLALGETSSTAYAGDKGKANADAITAITKGTTKVGAAGTADKLANERTITLSGAANGSASFDGSANVTINTTLADSTVIAGTYSAVTVNSKGLVTYGEHIIEVGTDGQTEPSANLAVGGLFFKVREEETPAEGG